MPNTLYFKNPNIGSWDDLGNWFLDAAATISASAIPWKTTNIYKDYDLAYATGSSSFVQPVYDSTIGSGFVITGVCSLNIDLRGASEDEPSASIAGGSYSGIIKGSANGGGTFRTGNITGGSFSGTVTVFSVDNAIFTSVSTASIYQINSGTFLGTVTAYNVLGGTFSGNTTVTNTLSDGTFSGTLAANGIAGGIFNLNLTINTTTGGTFNGIVTHVTGAVSGGIFNSTFINTSGNISGGTFNSSFTQTAGNVSGGTFNGTYSRVTGNVTGGTFSNGIIYQFFRDGWPPPLVFPGYNTKALDVLGTGLV